LGVLLEHDASRCPTCHSRLRGRRGRPIVLGQTSRLANKATLGVDRQSRTHLEHGYWSTEAAAPDVERRSSQREINPNPEPVIALVVDPHGPAPLEIPEPRMSFDVPAESEIGPEPNPCVETEPEALLLDEPAEDVPAEVVDRAAAQAADVEHVATPLGQFDEPAEPNITESELDTALDGDIYSAVAALHRKARSDVSLDDQASVQLFDPVVAQAPTNRRRWSLTNERRGRDVE
jgi:hypothetical protein